MEPKQVDPAEFRDGQRKQWNQAATGWRKWSELIDRSASAVSERLVELAGVEPGSRVLDVAAGYGEPSLTAARVAGSEGSVVASDISAEMLAYGRERASAAGLDNIEFVESDAAGLDFAEGSFDSALSRFGIIFEPDGEGAAARVRAFLEPGGRMAIASWGQPEEVPFIAIPMATAIQRLNVPPPPPGTPGPLSRPTPEALGGLLEGGGFSEVRTEDVQVTMEWESPEEFTTFVKDIAPPIRAIIDPHPEEVQDETWQAITDAIRQQAGDDGTVKLTNLVLMAAGSA
jgi:enediyne biosynthesis protein CalE5